MVIDENEKPVCEVRVTKAFSESEFGCITLNADVKRPPVKDDVLRRKAADAKPIIPPIPGTGDVPGRSSANSPTAGGTDGR